jgi:predicted GNAT family acetyltransferase
MARRPAGGKGAIVGAGGVSYNDGIMAEPLNIQHDPAGQRFFVKMEGFEAVLMYRRSNGEIDLYHTYVPEVFRGRGVAEQLCRAAFEYAKAEGLQVVPSCSYISGAYLKRHKEYEPLTKRGGPSSNPLVSG